MLLGVIADDFTGASDIANTIAKGYGSTGGLKTIQYLGVPEDEAAPDIEAGVISLKSRSIPANEAISQSLDALKWLQNQGCRQIVFKYCSTFDSTRAGNIGPVGEALAQHLGVKGVIVCPAFPDAGRTIFNGHLFVEGQLLNESGMENHPLNPMADPNLRRWLTLQCKEKVGLVKWSQVNKGAIAIATALHEARTRKECLVIVDAITNPDLLSIGEACIDASFITGGSGIALGLPANFIKSGLAVGRSPEMIPQMAPEVVLVGSCSRTTLKQVEIHAQNHPILNISVESVMSGTVPMDELLTFVKSNTSRAPLIYSSASSTDVQALQLRYGSGRIAMYLDRMFGDIASRLYASGIRRIVVGGGETSGAIISALGAKSFHIGPEIDPGVPALISADGLGLSVALKSGNFGAPDFFSKP
jgi:uncharacterized protein YgbK (DUF1537 family)